MNVVLMVVCVLSAMVLVAVLHNSRLQRREAYVREFIFPKGLYDKLRKRRPELTHKDCALIAHALRQFFLAFAKSGGRFVAMPSQVADDLWHEFILYTRNYERFCRKAFGRFLHHTPAVAMTDSVRQQNEGIRRTWWYTCKEENIDPRKPSRLPLLFALDAKMKIADGFFYATDCRSRTGGPDGGVYCGSDIPAASCGGFGCGGSAAASTDGAGCGGSGCGGGGCGGGGD